MHQVTVGSVTFEQVEVDLDYAEIQENLDLSDYVEVDDLEEQINYCIPEPTDGIQDLLREFLNQSQPCNLGHEFINAVQKAMLWQGDRFVEPPFTNTEAHTALAEASRTLRQEVRTVLKEIFYDMETTVSNRHTIAEGR